MKLSTLRLAASLALNASLLIGALVLVRDGNGSPLFNSGDGKRADSAPAPSSAQLSQALKSGDHTALRDQLRALGLSDSTVPD